MAAFDKTPVHDFLSACVFPKLKFVSGTDVTMQYSTEKKTLCNPVMEGCNQVHNRAGMIWWEIVEKQTLTEIKLLRNDATNNMKVSFMGTHLIKFREARL
jgi:hypothetical protein